DRGLRGRVVRLPEIPQQAGTGGGVDDATVDGASLRFGLVTPTSRGGAARQPRAPYVDAHHEIEVLSRHVPDGTVADDAGVVDQDVELAELRVGALDHGVGLVLVADVAEVRDRLPPALGDELHDPFGVATLAFAPNR